MARALLVLLPLLVAGVVGFGLGRRRPSRERQRLASALPVVTALRALSSSDPLAQPAQHRLHQLEALDALERWDRAELGQR